MSHTIGIVQGDVFWPLLESVEGTEQEPWPPSPPMQQMVEESFAPGASPVLLGVGLSGNGHWSTAIETQHERLLKFDIACKNSKSASSFGSEYRVMAQAEQDKPSGMIAMQLETTLGAVKIELSASMGQIYFCAEKQTIRISPHSDPESMKTHRWCYEVFVP